MIKTKYLIILLVLIAQSGCEKSESFGEVIVTGKVWDDIRQKPVANLLVYMYDVECKNFSCHQNMIVDSVRTDNNGLYEIKYVRKNQNNLYVRCGYKKDSYAYLSKNENEYQFLKDGTYSGKNFILRKTSVLRIRAIVKNNLYPPLRLHDNISSNFVKIYGTNADTLVYLHGVPNTINQLDLIVSSPDYTYYRRRTDYINLGNFADTLDITVSAVPDTFPIKKY